MRAQTGDTGQLFRRILTSKKGSLLVDAAVCIPVFILAMAAILSLVLHVGTEEKNFREMAEQSQVLTVAYAAAGIDDDRIHYLHSDGQNLAFRPFSGADDSGGDTLVYIFPKRGERYHIAGCPTMKPGEIETILTDQIRRSYRACEICKPETLPNGAPVCLYSESSRIFHRKSCATITKSYEKICKSEAEARGYTPCMHCIRISGASSGNSE